MSKRGIQTQKLPQASVCAVPISSRRQPQGRNQPYGQPPGK